MIVLALLPTPPRALAQEPPRPDVDRVEPTVRERVEAARRAVLANDDSAAAWGRYAMLLDAHGMSAEAIAAYRVAGRLDPQDFRWLYHLGSLLDLVDRPAAIRVLQQALVLDPDYEPLRIRLGEALEESGDLAAARRQFEAAVRIDPSSAFGHLGLGRLDQHDGALEEALEHLRRARELAPKTRAVVASLAQAEFRAGNKEEARRLVLEARDLPRTTYYPDPIRAAIKAHGVDRASQLQRVRSLRDRGHLEEALAEARALASEDPSLAAAPALVAELAHRLRRPELVVSAARRALEIDPGLIEIEPILATDLVLLARFDEGAEVARRVLRRDPDEVDMRLVLAVAAAQTGDFPALVANLDHALAVGTEKRDPLRLMSALLGELATLLEGAGKGDAASLRRQQQAEIDRRLHSP